VKGFLRPKVNILGEEALVPKGKVVFPPPNQFSHRLKQAQPYYYNRQSAHGKPVGHFAKGERVLLVRREADAVTCWVLDGKGLYVETHYTALEKL
jgi:hypothetical protein